MLPLHADAPINMGGMFGYHVLLAPTRKRLVITCLSVLSQSLACRLFNCATFFHLYKLPTYTYTPLLFQYT